MFFDHYPYTNFHNVNLDWVLQAVKSWGALVEANNRAFQDLKEANEDFKAYVENYLHTVLPTEIEAQITESVDNWLDEHPEATTTVQDHSLTYEKLVIGTLGFVAPEMYGAVGDGIENDTEAFRSALANHKNIVCMPEKTYLIDIDLDVDGTLLCGLPMRSGTCIDLNGSTLRVGSMLNPSSSARRTLIYMKEISDVTIKNGSLIGLIPETGGSEYYHCFNILSSHRVRLVNLYIHNFYGDGAYIGEYSDTREKSENIFMDRCVIDSAGRNGVSLIHANNVVISNCNIKNISKKAPMSGIDFEPNRNYQSVTNVSIYGCNITSCPTRGILLGLSHNPAMITACISNCTIESTKWGLDITAQNISTDPTFARITTSGIVTVNNSVFNNIEMIAIKIDSTCYDLACKVSDTTIINGQGSSGAPTGSNTPWYLRSIAYSGETIAKMRNIVFDDITLLNSNFNINGFVRNTEFFYRGNVTTGINVGTGTSAKVEQMVDDYTELGRTRTIPTSSGSISKKYVLPDTATGNCTVTFGSNLPIDFDIVFVNLSDTYNIIDSNNNVIAAPKSIKTYSCKYKMTI